MTHFAINFFYTVSSQSLHVREATNNTNIIIYSFLCTEYRCMYRSIHVVSIGT